MARRGLDRDVVAEAACALADAEGLDAVTLAKVAAQLEVRTPSLYNHVDGLDGLRRAIALCGIRELGDAVRGAAVGRSGRDALAAVATAYRDYARAHPGRYAATQLAANDDPEIGPAGTAVIDVFVAVLRAWELEGEDAVHAVRIVRSALHGFVALEAGGGFGLPLDLDETFDRLVAVLADGL